MANKFKHGDKVRCVNGGNGVVKTGGIYIVVGYNASGNVKLEGLGENGSFESRFELAQPPGDMWVGRQEIVTMQPFEVGDIVRCMDVRRGYNIHVGGVYKVCREDSQFIGVIGDNGNESYGWMHYRFELVSKGSVGDALLLLCDDSK